MIYAVTLINNRFVRRFGSREMGHFNRLQLWRREFLFNLFFFSLFIFFFFSGRLNGAGQPVTADIGPLQSSEMSVWQSWKVQETNQ